ncbi:MAG TPA: sugar-binding domain-containing protein, partial [Leptolinea sp.]
MDNNEIRMALLSRVASLYYNLNKTQQEISDSTGIARPMVSRMIAEARERGVVEINVHYPWTWKHLEESIVKIFGLKSARVMVLDTDSHTEMLVGLGLLTAEYFNQILHDNMVIGVSWGSAIQHMINALKPRKMKDVEIIQLIGATGLENNLSDGPLLAQLLTNRLSSTCRYLHAPLVVENKMVRDALLQERSIKETLNRAGEADVALIGVGAIDPDLYSLKMAGYMTEEERQQLAVNGVVGDICGQHYSINGEWLDIDINHRVVGIDLPTLLKIDTVIA